MDANLDRTAIEAMWYDPDFEGVRFLDETQDLAARDMLATVPRGETGVLAASIRKDRSVDSDGTPQWVVIARGYPGWFAWANSNEPYGTHNVDGTLRELHNVPEGGVRHSLDIIHSFWAG